jgi:transposase
MARYPEDAWERAMKVQEVILRAMAKRITWWQAAEILGISDRSLRRWRQRYEEHGYDGLFDRRRGRPSPKRVPVATVEEVLRLYQERYPDFNVRHFHEKLREEHGIRLSYTWVKRALQGAGLVKKARKRGVHRKRRVPRPVPGMLLHLDGSRHRWFQDERWYDLIEVLDDATNETYYAQLVEQESTRTVMAALKEVIQKKGRFCALYSDRASHFFETPKAGGPVDPRVLTQVGRALKELGIEMIPAYSPQARGRSERRFGTWQGRLPQELRLAGIGTVEEANRFLRERYIPEMNGKFSRPAAERGHAFVPAGRQDLDRIFSVQHSRLVAHDNTVRLGERLWQLERTRFRSTLAGCRVTICEHLDGRVTVLYGPHVVGRYPSADGRQAQPLSAAKRSRVPGCGNDAPRKAWKTPKTSFPPFPPRLDPDSVGTHISTAATTTVRSLWLEAKKNQNRTDHVL